MMNGDASGWIFPARTTRRAAGRYLIADGPGEDLSAGNPRPNLDSRYAIRVCFAC